MPKEWQTGVVVPLFKKGDQRVCANYRDITLLSLPGKVYSKVLEWRVRPIVEPQIEEEQCGFRPGRGTTDQLFTLARILEGTWEYAHPVYMCFVDLEKAYDRVPREKLWEVLREYGVRGSLLRAIQSLYSQSESCVRVLGSQSVSFSDEILINPKSYGLVHDVGVKKICVCCTVSKCIDLKVQLITAVSAVLSQIIYQECAAR